MNPPLQPSPSRVIEEEAPHTDAIAQVLRVLSILRRRWLVVAVTVVLAVAAAALAVTMLRPRWRASTSVVLHMSGPQVLDKVKGIAEDADARVVGYKEYYQTQRTIIHSRAVAKLALAKLGLASDPTFLGIDGIESEAERVAVAATIDPIERLRDLVSVEEVRNSRVLEISAEYPDPEVARDIADRVAEAYLEYVQSSRTDLGSVAKDDIAAERTRAESSMNEAEHALQDFKDKHGIAAATLSDRQDVINQDVMIWSSRAKEAEAERITHERMLEQAKRLHEAGNLAGATLLPENRRALFETMRQQELEAEAEFATADEVYGPKHVEHAKAKRRLELAQRKIEREAKSLIESLEAEVAAAAATEHDLERKLGGENSRALKLGGLEREYRELERAAKKAEEDYLLIARRDTEIAVSNRVEDEGIEVLDWAVAPNVPVFPRKGLMFALAVVAGLSMGSLLAVAVDFRDHRIRGLLDLERALASFGVPVLGQLPLLPPDTRLGVANARAQRRQRDLYAHLYPQSLMAERCRGIRTSLAFSQGPDALRTIMVTSPSSSEGKSSTAMNLALSFCQASKRVVLIDADMRRPRIHQVFASPREKEGTGLSAYLTGVSTIDEVILDAPDDAPAQLKIVPCGGLPANPAELLDTPVFRRALAELRDRFDVVIVDTPPVLPVTDPLIISREVDGVVVVTRCESTTRGELQRTLAQLAKSDTNILGVVLNEVDARQERYAYNSAYYTYRANEAENEPA
ncbi:MAG: polysaccharide biosynthesis tyrosine autokinase [Deltaproteobacteria bacterium]|nr:polysaccharide biosynthesis tyrosine autokinase [Deltaproteobacteria bacterium]